MLTDREIQALFADVSENDSPKEEKPKSKTKTNQKSRSTKKKSKITFDPDIFLDGVSKDTNENENAINIPLDFFTKSDNLTILPEFSNLISRISFYLNSQIHYLMDDFANELISLVDTTPKEREVVDNFINEICESIKDSFCIYDDDPNKLSTFFTPESFDMYADRFHQVFMKCEEFSQISYDTLQIKSLRKNINNSYTKIKKEFQAYPELLSYEINELLMCHNNYNNLLNTKRVQEKSQKNRELSLNCKRIEQKILYDHYSRQIDFVKDSQAKYSQFLEINEFNKSITMDKISDSISSLKDNFVNGKKNIKDVLFKQEKNIQRLKSELKILRNQYHFMQKTQMSIAYSTIQDDENSKQFRNSFVNQNNSMVPMNYNSFYNKNESSLIQQPQLNLTQENHSKSTNQQDYFSKMKKTFNSLLHEQNKNLENTSDFIKSIEDDKALQLMRRSYFG